jgi:hypothetical protein
MRRRAGTRRRGNPKQSSSETILKSSRGGVKERAAATLQSEFRSWARTAATPESSIARTAAHARPKRRTHFDEQEGAVEMADFQMSNCARRRSANLQIASSGGQSCLLFLRRHFVSQCQSTDFPNSRLIASWHSPRVRQATGSLLPNGAQFQLVATQYSSPSFLPASKVLRPQFR